MILRLLNPQGIAGLIASALLAILLGAARIEVHHWKKQSAQFERLYRDEVGAHAQTVAAVRTAREEARALDRANAARVRRDQSAIDERTSNDFEARLAAARARAGGLRQPAETTAADRGGRNAPVPGLSLAAGGAGGPAAQAGLSAGDALIATEQAIQLDELIKWVRAQAAVRVDPKPE